MQTRVVRTVQLRLADKTKIANIRIRLTFARRFHARLTPKPREYFPPTLSDGATFSDREKQRRRGERGEEEMGQREVMLKEEKNK